MDLESNLACDPKSHFNLGLHLNTGIFADLLTTLATIGKISISL